MDDKKVTDGVMEQFPDEIVSQILIRLPAKSIHRFKCVSKRWNYIINNAHFTSSYISLHGPSWVILDRMVRVDTKSNAKVMQFDLQYPPEVSSLQIAPFQMADEPFLESIDGNNPSIMYCSNGVFLFQFRIKRNPYQHKPLTLNGQFYFDKRFEEDALFVANPLTGEWFPIPKSPYPILHGGTVGFISQANSVGVLERFLVVEYQPLIGSNLATLMCFSSEIGKWVTKSANYMLSMHQWEQDGALEFDGKLFWFDRDCGLIVWDDPFGSLDRKGKVKCRFIAKPPLPSAMRVFVGGGLIQCLQMKRDDYVLWRLKDHQVEGEWSLVHKVSILDIWSDESYLSCGLDKITPTCCFIHPLEADVVFFHIQGQIFSLNFRTKRVESCGDGYLSIIEHVFVMPYVLPSWPTSLPPCLTATYAKEQGNNNFMACKFNEAISCYTRSIAISRSAEAYANRAMAYIMVSRFHEAENDCTKALNLDSLYFKAYCRRALARKELGNVEGSMYDVEFALKLEPDDQDMKQLYAELKS